MLLAAAWLVAAPSARALGRPSYVAATSSPSALPLVDAAGAAILVPEGYNAVGRDWEETVRNNARSVATAHEVAAVGYHTLEIWMVDPAVVVQKIVVTTKEGEGRTSCLGPHESLRDGGWGAGAADARER